MESPAERANRIEQALRSNDPDTVLEGRVAKAVENDAKTFCSSFQ
jgi:hypothetical protein